MADWQRAAESYFPGERINNAWDLHLRAARILIDNYFAVSIGLKPKSSGFLSSELADLFDDLDFQAVDAAKTFMAERFAAAIMVHDSREDSADMLHELFEENELAMMDDAVWSSDPLIDAAANLPPTEPPGTTRQ